MRQSAPMMPPAPQQPMSGGLMGGMMQRPQPQTGGMMQPRMDNTATNTPDMRGAIIQYLARNGFQGF